MKETKNEKPQMRQIIIETDGNIVRLVKVETAGTIELIAILKNIIEFLNKPKQ